MEDSQAEFETRQDAVPAQEENAAKRQFVAMWLKAIDLAGERESKWRKCAEETIELYRSEEEKAPDFNILYSNIETIVPAIYNSVPQPDIRNRYLAEDADSKQIGYALERAISYSAEFYDLDATFHAATQDYQLVGRGTPIVNYEPIFDDEGKLVSHRVWAECKSWKDLRIGSAKKWEDVPWLAIPEYMTRDELKKLSPELGGLVKLETRIDGSNEGDPETPDDIFKRALVWKIWDKQSGQIIYIAESYRDSPLKVEEPPFNIKGFFPVPKPMYAIRTNDTLTPVVPYEYYKNQAKELDEITARIRKLVKACRWRGVALGDFPLSELEVADDGDIVPTGNNVAVQNGQAVDNMFYFMPVDKLIVVLRELVAQREQIKQTIYEITGISDIIRGSTNPNETLGAQQLKAQWGSARLQKAQAEVQRMARDVYRMMAEIVAENFDLATIKVMTGVELTPQQEMIMRSDTLRSFKIDIETDSTIRADLNNSQKNIAEFVQGFGGLIQAVGPAVQSGDLPRELVVEMIASFSRVYKLGRQVEDALDRMARQVKEQAQQPQPQANPEADVKLLETKANIEIKNQELQLKKYEIDTKAVLEAALEKYKTDVSVQVSAQQAEQNKPQPISVSNMPDEVLGAVKVLPETINQIAMQNAQVIQSVANQNAQALEAVAQQNMAAIQSLVAAVTAPKRAVRDENGKIIGTETVLNG